MVSYVSVSYKEKAYICMREHVLGCQKTDDFVQMRCKFLVFSFEILNHKLKLNQYQRLTTHRETNLQHFLKHTPNKNTTISISCAFSCSFMKKISLEIEHRRSMVHLRVFCHSARLCPVMVNIHVRVT